MNNEERRQQAVIKVKEQLQLQYGGIYTFEEDTYKNSDSKLKGFCSLHGGIEFTGKSVVHRNTIPCTQCRKRRVTDTESFIAKAKEVHGDKYKYNNAKYSGYHNQITITCKLHGDFSQRVSDHLSDKGCNKCGNNIQTSEEIVSRFREIHGNTYLYDKVKFETMHKKVTITCPTHGDFNMKPADHIF